MKVVVLYFSYTGNTLKAVKQLEKIALSQKDEIKLIPIEIQGSQSFFWRGLEMLLGLTPKIKKIDQNISQYQVLIIACPIWGFNCPPAVKAAIKSIPSFKHIPVAVFLNSHGKGVKKTLNKIKQLIVKKQGKICTYIHICSEEIKKNNWQDLDTFWQKIKQISAPVA